MMATPTTGRPLPRRTIRAHLPIQKPFVYPFGDGDGEGRTAYTGLLYDVWVHVAGALRESGYVVEETFGPTRGRGVEYWNEAIARGQYDVVVTPATPSLRVPSVVVSATVYVTGFTIIVRSRSESWPSVIGRLVFFELLPLFLLLCAAGITVGYAMYWYSREPTKRAFFSYSIFNVLNMFGTSSNIAGYVTQNNVTKLGRPRKRALGAWWWWGGFLFLAAASVVVSTITRSYITTRMLEEKRHLGTSDAAGAVTAGDLGRMTVLAKKGSYEALVASQVAEKVVVLDEPLPKILDVFQRQDAYDAVVANAYDAHRLCRHREGVQPGTVDLGSSPVGFVLSKRLGPAALDLVDRTILRLKDARALHGYCKRYAPNLQRSGCLV